MPSRFLNCSFSDSTSQLRDISFDSSTSLALSGISVNSAKSLSISPPSPTLEAAISIGIVFLSSHAAQGSTLQSTFLMIPKTLIKKKDWSKQNQWTTHILYCLVKAKYISTSDGCPYPNSSKRRTNLAFFRLSASCKRVPRYLTLVLLTCDHKHLKNQTEVPFNSFAISWWASFWYRVSEIYYNIVL